jgi:hypothetical protein
MRARTILVSLAAGLACAALCLAADVNMGTWKLNDAKSKIDAAGPKNSTVVYEMAGDSVKVTVDGMDKDGKATHQVWTGKYDGKDYPVTGDSSSDTRAYTKVDDHTMSIVSKKGGKSVGTAKVVVAPDGKSRTVTIMMTDAAGKSSTSSLVYDKQ